jgi:Fe-S cluster biosynthesis and repair protein YggX
LQMMSKTCLRCGKTFEEIIEDPAAEKYPACSACWKEWTTYAVMVMNEMRLDMSLPEHRKALRKYERAFFGLEKGIGEIEKKPDNPEAQHDHHHH